MPMRRRRALQPPQLHSAGPSCAPRSLPVGDAYCSEESGLNVYFVAFCSVVFVVVPDLILINIKPLQKQWGKLDGVEVLAAGVVVLQFLQFILHHLRFRRSHWLVQWGAWAAYYLPVPLAALAVGMMLRLRRPFWPVAVLFGAAQSDSMAAFSLDDDSQNMRRFAKRALYVAYMIVALLQVTPATELFSLLLAGSLVFFVHLRVGSMARIPSGDICMVAAEGAAINVGAPSTSSHSQPQPQMGAVVTVGSLESLGSAVSGSTTYEDIVGLDYSPKLKDASLSAALFLQLLQRYHNPRQRVDSSNANLAFKKLLEGETRDYAKAMKLVEVQLSFMYDHFFSAHGSASWASYKLYLDHWVFKIGFLMHIHSLVGQQQGEHSTFAFGVVYLLVLLELCQLTYYLTSDRFLVSYMCDPSRVLSSRHGSSTGKPLRMAVLNAIAETRGSAASWRSTLGQYSLVDDCECFTWSLAQRRLMWGTGSYIATASPAVVLSMDEVEAWILCRIVVTPTPEPSPSSPTSAYDDAPSSITSPSLQRRREAPPRQIQTTSRSSHSQQETEIHTILTWHVATWLCEMRDVNRVLPSSHYMAATKLSRYCAYLVAFHPELLPAARQGHQNHTAATRVFDEAVREVDRLCLQRETSSYGRYARFMSAWEQGKLSPLGVLEQGARLSKHLISYMDSTRGSENCWSILADFWAETVLHLAHHQSGNASAHIEHLAKGGELVTRLWAMLSNAGIHTKIKIDTIKREQKKVDIRPPDLPAKVSSNKRKKQLIKVDPHHTDHLLLSKVRNLLPMFDRNFITFIHTRTWAMLSNAALSSYQRPISSCTAP